MTSDPTDWSEKVRQLARVDEQGWKHLTGLTKSEAEELLDWLEVNGVPERAASFRPEEGFEVRWRE